MSETDVAESETIAPETVSKPETRLQYTPLAKELRERCKILYYQGVRPDIISAQTGVKPSTLKTWVNRFKWNVTVAEGKRIMLAVGTRGLTREVNTQLEAASGKLRERFAGILEKAGEALDRASIRPTAKSVKAAAEALEPLVRSAKVVHSWGNEGPTGIILSEALGEDQTPIAITASVEALPAVACGPEPTTGSVPAIECNLSTPQVAQ